MENKEKLVKLIFDKENRNAVAFLKELRGKSPSFEYGVARERILLIETAKSLNEMMPAFYADVKSLAIELFENNMPLESAVDYLCEKVTQSARAEKQELFLKACDFIKENLLNSQLTVSLTAEYVGLSQSALVKLFGEKISLTPGDYIGKLRVEESFSCLLKNFSVEKTSQVVGFSSVEAYIRAFRKHTQMTPGVWKRKNNS